MTKANRRPVILAVLLGGLALTGTLAAEYVFFTPPGGFAIEVSLQDSPYLRLPLYRNAITSLIVTGDTIVGGTSARSSMSPYLFSASISGRKLESVLDLEQVIPGQQRIVCGFGRGADRQLWTGTLPQREGDSGHLIEVRLENGSVKARDLGSPVPGEGILALAAAPSEPVLYGIAHPSGSFFVHDLRTSQTRVYKETAPSRRTVGFLDAYALEPESFLCRRLTVDAQGRVYGSMPVSKLFRYDPGRDAIEILPDEIPQVWGRRPLGRVDSWANGPDGLLYGGNAGDGQLFSLDPSSGKVVNLGKPAMMWGMPGLAFGKDGRLYGVTGRLPGYAHLFYYEPGGKGFVDLGNPRFTMVEPGIEQGIPWRGYQFATVAASEDGRWIVLGENEALSQLMIFPIE